jgi:predicted transcriptional regulator
MKWKDKLINYLVAELSNDEKWKYIVDKLIDNSPIGIHLAIFNEPFLSLVLNGEKKVESRFSINRVTPFMKVTKGDVILVKEAGGEITGLFVAGEVKYFQNLKAGMLLEIENKYGELICASYDSGFWENRRKAKYATLIEVEMVRRLSPVRDGKSDKTGWSVIRTGITNSLFN